MPIFAFYFILPVNALPLLCTRFNKIVVVVNAVEI